MPGGIGSSGLISADLDWNLNPMCFLSGGLTAFKSGMETIVTPADIEGDLVDDIIARAKFYKRHGF